MKQWFPLIIAILFPIYLCIVLLTDISLTGFWTDILFSLLLFVLALRFVFKRGTGKDGLTIAIKAMNVLCCVVVVVVVLPVLANPFSWDILKLRSFYFQSVDKRLFNAYFKPVGSYSGGYGNFWITEMPKYFPLVEWEVYWDRTVDHDFKDDTFDGQPIDNYEMVRFYIKDEVIDKQKAKE